MIDNDLIKSISRHHQPPSAFPMHQVLHLDELVRIISSTRTSRLKGLHRYSPSHPAANRSRVPSWTFCGDVRLICLPFSSPCPPIPGQLPIMFSYVKIMLYGSAVNLICFSVAVERPLAGRVGTIQKVYCTRRRPGST